MSDKKIAVEVRSAFVFDGKVQSIGTAETPNVIEVGEKDARKLLHRGNVVLAAGAGDLGEDEGDPDADRDAVVPAGDAVKAPAAKKAKAPAKKGADADAAS